MKFTLSWLKDHLDTDASVEAISERLTQLGLEVEELDDKKAFDPFVIAKIISAKPHPDADKLRLLSVDTGAGTPVQVVCGAPNAREGLIGAFAAPGTYVPGLDITLSIGKIRGIESHGMMCSQRELEMSDEHDGIIELPQDAPVGQSFAAYANLNDPVFTIGLTPNRPDCTGVYGIARDLAASGLGTLKSAPIEPIAGNGPCPVGVTIEASDLCPGFGLRLVKNVKNTASPQWMQRRLIAIGLRPINALVDITNYMTFDYGRPLHVFDAAKVAGGLVVRTANEGEELLALDGKTYSFTPNICVISDDNGVESIGGIMGGEHSGCDENTTDVLIESALWNPKNIARTGRDLGIITDARYRFERGVDPAFMIEGIELATKLVVDLCGGTPSEILVEGYQAIETKTLEFPLREVKRLTGLELTVEQIKAYLDHLGFENSGNGDVLSVNVPSWRPDIEGKADLVEEVMRIHGIEHIAPTPLERGGSINARILTQLQIRTRQVRRTLATRGMMEAINYSFISKTQAEIFGGGDPSLALSNPIAAELSDMRPSLLPGLLLAAQRNSDKGNGDVALFEVSGIYQGDTVEKQRRAASGVRRGTAQMQAQGRHWQTAGQTVSVYDAKADALAALAAAGAPVDRLQIVAGGPSWYHPGRCGKIQLGPKIQLGHFGEFHPMCLEQLDVSGPLCGFELFLDAIPQAKAKATRTKPRLDVSALQSVRRDFAFVIDQSIAAGDLTRAASAADKKLITNVAVFDLFEGPSVGEGKKSVAIEVTLQPSDKTLTEEDFDVISRKIIANVEKQTGGILRG